jgi:hypothetical protein
VKVRRIVWISVGLFFAGTLILTATKAVAETNGWESALEKMRKGAAQMIEGARMLRDNKDLGSAERTIKDGHRMMMEAEKATAQIQKETMKRGAKMMMDGLQVLKSRGDVGGAEKLMAQGQEIIIEADKMINDPRPEKLMHGSRTMMRGLRMMQAQDMKTAHRIVTEGGTVMMEAAKP